ncbi:MAG: ATP-dependent Clp protease proteolytic subunit [Paludibacteraceae bacterium]|nr:ATP-dependent Clp protease proteolytic subunit [Paludibacteraceae bacterium]
MKMVDDFRDSDGYYDIEVSLEDILASNSAIDELFYLKDLQQRKIFLTTMITQSTVDEVVHSILQLNREDADIPVEERKPILLYLTSIGGESDAGFEMIDVIRMSRTPVHVINLGYCYSMGFLIFLAGHRRFASENAKFLMHDGSSYVYNSTGKAKDQMLFNDRVEEKIKNYVLKYTNITEDEYDDKQRQEWYMFADEAKEKGIVDSIIGVDCDIMEIV